MAVQAGAVAAALAELDVRPHDRVLIMLPAGPGFAESFAGAIRQGAVPLPVNPAVSAHEVMALAADAGARLVLASADLIQALADLDAQPPVVVDESEKLWAAALRRR